MKYNNKIAIFLAARSGSKRLPNKHFLKLNYNLRVIDLCILRLKKAKLVNKIFLCTTKKKQDDKFKHVCKLHNIKLFRGSTKNVSKRFIDCAKENSINTIVRITADCPIIDPKLIDNCIRLHFKRKVQYTTNTLKLSYPDGLDVEVFNLEILIKSYNLYKTDYSREHVTTFMRKSKKIKKTNYKSRVNYANRRWTLDNLEDYLFLKKL